MRAKNVALTANQVQQQHIVKFENMFKGKQEDICAKMLRKAVCKLNLSKIVTNKSQ
jgi:hypothetical protein